MYCSRKPRGIENLIPKLDQNFVNAVHMIMESKGRVVVTGMGQIRTYCPQDFGYPGQHGHAGYFPSSRRSHPRRSGDGDRRRCRPGHFQERGNAGSSEYAAQPEAHRCQRFIAIVGEHNSTLAKNSDVILDASVEKEACPLGLAPTTSTTVALALGDALAVVLLSCHHFTKDQFAIFHPGGSLGRKLLLTVENVMHKGEDNPVISEDSTVQDALFMMTEKGLGAVSVVDEDGVLVGLVTDGDVRRGLETGSNFLQWPVDAMMTKSPRIITNDKLAAEAMHIMEKNQPRPITVLPVVDKDNKAVGMIHLTDLLRQGVV
jgi:arabinose-5-phosphate isomerase